MRAHDPYDVEIWPEVDADEREAISRAALEALSADASVPSAYRSRWWAEGVATATGSAPRLGPTYASARLRSSRGATRA